MTTPDSEPAGIELTVDDGVAVARIDRPGGSTNTLDPALAADLATVVDRCAGDDAIRAVVLASSKPSGFMAGADIELLRSIDDPATAIELLGEAHRILASVEELADRGKPVVAAIHGNCLGAGLELALACSIRIASDDERTTRLGLPEVKLGLLPGAGATQRLPALVGVQTALDLMLTGRTVPPGRALGIGLVDELVPGERLIEIATRRAREAADGSAEPTGGLLARVRDLWSPARSRSLALERTPPGRRVLFARVTERTLARTKGNLPAPPAIIRVVRTGLERGPDAGYAAELEAFAELVVSPEAQALLGVFADQRSVRRDLGIADVPAATVTKIGVLGGGLMGSGIAAVSTIEAGLRARIKEVDDAGVRRALSRVSKMVDGAASRGRLDARQAERAVQRVTATTELNGFDDAEVIIEAVFEDLGLKRSMLAEVERVCGPDTIFASNTSSLPITDIAEGATRPERVIGMHYFSPAEKMPLLEVVVTDRTVDEVTATCVALGKAQGKTVIVVEDGPGFYTTRVLVPYMNEIGHLVAEGVRIDAIDRAMTQWGFAVGPVTLMDEVGIDVGASITEVMHHGFGSRMAPPDNLANLLADGRRGRKNGRGFYRYENGERYGVDETVYDVLGGEGSLKVARRTLQDRLGTLFLNEAVRCLEDGVIRSARDGDVGAVHGLGFPPFRGGPFTYIDRVGAADVVTRMDNFARVHGERYQPADLLREHAGNGRRFRE